MTSTERYLLPHESSCRGRSILQKSCEPRSIDRLFNTLISGEPELERREDFCITPLGHFRNTKLAYCGFFSQYTLNIIQKVEKPLRCKKVLGTANKRFGIVAYKYLRKFAFDTMTSERVNIPESVADFIGGGERRRRWVQDIT